MAPSTVRRLFLIDFWQDVDADLALSFSPLTATHVIFKALWSAYENKCCLKWFSVLRQRIWPIYCHHSTFISSELVSFAEFVEEKHWARGGWVVMEHLISCSLWEPLRHRCERICDIESVLITKTGIKGDWTQLSSELFEGFIGKCSFGGGSCLDLDFLLYWIVLEEHFVSGSSESKALVAASMINVPFQIIIQSTREWLFYFCLLMIIYL